MSQKEKYIVTIGTACIDEYYSIPCWLQEGGKAQVQSISAVVGGMVPNAACVLAGYGIKTYFFDVMNSGPTTCKILDNLKFYGLDVSYVLFDETLPDVKCFIFLTPEERTVFAVDGRKPLISFDEKQLSLLRDAAYIYTTLYNFQKTRNAQVVADELKIRGTKFAFDIETAVFSSEDRMLLKKANVLFFNQYGFEGYCKGYSPAQCYEELFANGVEIVVVTLGKDGCYCRTRTEEICVDGIKVSVTDPTGAGDTFNSSFLRCILEGMPLREAALFANAAASYAVTQLGPKGGVNTVEGVQKLMEQYYTDRK